MDERLVSGVVEAARKVIASGAISANGHGNVSLRGPGGDEMYFTTAPTLNGLGPDGIARIGLDGTLREASFPPFRVPSCRCTPPSMKIIQTSNV